MEGEKDRPVENGNGGLMSPDWPAQGRIPWGTGQVIWTEELAVAEISE